MKRILVVLALMLGIVFGGHSAEARGSRGGSTYHAPRPAPSYRPKTQPVRGYVRHDGTYVAPYRRAPKR